MTPEAAVAASRIAAGNQRAKRRLAEGFDTASVKVFVLLQPPIMI
jgi:hypothetical protein